MIWRAMMTTVLLCGLVAPALGDDELRVLRAEVKLLRAEVRRLRKKVKALEADNVRLRAGGATSRPTTQPGRRRAPRRKDEPKVPLWKQPLRTTLDFPGDREASLQTDAQWQKFVARLKGQLLVGQMEVMEVGASGEERLVVLAKDSLWRSGAITMRGALYRVLIETDEPKAQSLRRGTGVLFAGTVKNVSLESVTKHPLSDTRLLDGYIVMVHMQTDQLRRGWVSDGSATWTHPGMRDWRKTRAKLQRKLNAAKTRLGDERRKKKSSPKLVARYDRTARELEAESVRSYRVAREMELRWQVLGKVAKD